MVKRFFWLLLMSCSLAASALTVTEEFTSSSYLSSGDLIWNVGLGVLQPPLENYNHSGGNEQFSMDIGQATHGSFALSTYANFGTINGSTLTIDTDQYPNGLQVSSFSLDSGWTLKTTGSNPLIIKSQSDIVVAGIIDCSGGDGQGLLLAGNASTGGSSSCGGATGGQGGAAPQKGGNGNGATVSGGDPGGAAGSGGGGGGGFNNSNPPTSGGGGSGGSGGNTTNDFAFSSFAAGTGSGSGGGGGFDSGGDGGGAGGGSGGMLALFAGRNLNVTSTGKLLLIGGQGGAANGTAGGGGGGAGGSLIAFAKVDLLGSPFAGGQVSTIGGNGGAPNGGNGGYGRTWVVDRLGVLNNGEVPVSPLVPGGTIQYVEGTFSATSKVIDLGVSKGTLSAAEATTTSTLCGSCSVTVEVATSDDKDFDPTGQFTSPVAFSVKRYLVFKITVVNGDRSNSPVIDKVTLTYDGHLVQDFGFVTGCGGVNDSYTSWATLFLFLTPLALVAISKRYWYLLTPVVSP